jgi:hypothetical protein
MAISGTYADGDAVSFNDCIVEVDLTPAASSWANIDSWATNVQVSGGAVPSTDSYTFTHTGAITFVGNRAPYEVTIECVYTETATDPFTEINAAFNASPGVLFDARWVPGGTATTNQRYATSGGRLMMVSQPQGAADGSNAIVFEFMIKCAGITQEANT